MESKTDIVNDNHGSYDSKTIAGGSRLLVQSDLKEAYESVINLAVKWRQNDVEANLRQQYEQHSSERIFYEASHNTFVATVSATPWGSCVDRKGAWIHVVPRARLRYIGAPGTKSGLVRQLRDRFKLFEAWVGIGRGTGNAIFTVDGLDNPPSEVVPWKHCPEGTTLIGAGGISSEEALWVCTLPELAHETFFVARLVNAAAFVYRVQDGSVERMGGIEHRNCPQLSHPIGALPLPGGFWVCSGGGISPPPVELPSRAPVLMVSSNPNSTAQQWYFDPIGASPSRGPADLASNGAGLMIVNRATGMALDHSGSEQIGPWWTAIVERYAWGAKGQVWVLEKHPSLDRYVIRWPTTGQVLDYVRGEDDQWRAVLHTPVNGAPAQLWEIRRVEGDYYTIVNHYSGLALGL
ncbi:MAG: RICIN domain-containing protein [Minicystis sp.]